MRIFFFLSLIIACEAFAFVDPTVLTSNQNAYYGTQFATKNITKEELFKVLNTRHISVGYSQARKILFGELYGQTDGRGKFVEDVYCGKKFHFNHVDDVSNMGNEVNIEHTWPQSKFSSRFNKEQQKSDLHHLYPTDSLANSRRANFNFGNVSESNDQLNVHNCDSSRLGHKNGQMIFTPPTQHRGNVARSLFYFSARYQMEIPQDEEAILRQWHTQDPVDEAERERHEAIVKHQVVRNPFVDFPELADQITNF